LGLTKNSNILTLIFVSIIMLSIGLRIYSPLADLPNDISISGSIYTDEGNQCHNSRSKVLYGKWYEDDWQITRYNPILPYFKYLIFKTFGVGLLQVRAVTILFSILILLLMYLIFKSYFSLLLSLLGTALVGLNFFVIMYGKIGTFEIPMVFWMIFSIYFIEKYRKTNNSFFLFLSGSTAFMAFVFKNISAYFVPVPFVSYLVYALFYNKSGDVFLKKNAKNSLLILIGILSAFLTWYILFYIPNKEWIMSAPGKYIGNQVIPKSISQAIGNFFAFNWKEQFFKIPVIWLFSILYLPVFYRKLVLKKSDITDLAFTFFFLSHTVFFMFMNHRPTRYLLPVIFAMIFMTLQYFSNLIDKKRKTISLSVIQKFSFSFLDTLWIILAYFFCVSPLLFKYFGVFKISKISLDFIILAFIISVLYNFISPKFFSKPKKTLFANRVPYIVVFILFVTSLMFNIYHLAKWDRNKTYTVLKINRDLKKNLKDSFIAGLTAPVSVLESKHRSLFLFPDFVNWIDDGTINDTFMKYPISHALLASFNHEISLYYNSWPEKMKNAKLIKNYNVKDQFLHLYSFKYPYIKKIKRLKKNTFELIIKNPNSDKSDIHINEIYLKKKSINKKIKASDVFIKKGKKLIILNNGSLKDHSTTLIKLVLDEDLIDKSKFVLFNIESSLKHEVLRYEGEKFPGRTGVVKRVKNSSADFVKFYDGEKHKSGFLIHGSVIPFEFSQGFVEVKFNLKFNGIRNSISPVCTIDIFDYDKQKIFAEKIIIPKKHKAESDKFKNYSIYTFIPSTKKIEFRLKTTDLKSKNKNTNIIVDYVDVTYYQGKIFYFES